MPIFVKSYIVHDGVTKICQGAFKDASNISEVELPSSVSSIEISAFKCPKMDRIIIKNDQCEINNNPDTIYSSVEIVANTGSTAQQYALDYDNIFTDINDAEPITPTPAPIFGDIDGDGVINSNDSSIILSYYAAISSGKDISLEDYVASSSTDTVTE